MGTPRLHIRPGNPDFLDLPWDRPIDDWKSDRLVEMPTGVHRHPVRFVGYPEGVYAIKELPRRFATSEYEVLEALEEVTSRAAEPAGLVLREWLDPHVEQAGAVVTRFVEHAFPYRNLLAGHGFGPRRPQMMDAIAGLLVELHLVGCFWGDCSLSNVLYRYDAGAIEAIMIDGETSEIYESLSDGQRAHDLEIMIENVAGEMADIAAMNGVELEEGDLQLGEDIRSRYEGLWRELNDDLVVTRDERYRIRERIARLNDLGFAVQDFDIEPTDAGDLIRMTVRVGGRTFNSERLRQLTGIDASENQAKVILGDLDAFLSRTGTATASGKSVGTFKWLTSSFEPTVQQLSGLWHGDDPVQGYCDFLHHRLVLAQAQQRDVPNDEAFDSWVESGFPGFPVG